jgi:hypothetical protein
VPVCHHPGVNLWKELQQVEYSSGGTGISRNKRWEKWKNSLPRIARAGHHPTLAQEAIFPLAEGVGEDNDSLSGLFVKAIRGDVVGCRHGALYPFCGNFPHFQGFQAALPTAGRYTLLVFG